MTLQLCLWCYPPRVCLSLSSAAVLLNVYLCICCGYESTQRSSVPKHQRDTAGLVDSCSRPLLQGD